LSPSFARSVSLALHPAIVLPGAVLWVTAERGELASSASRLLIMLGTVLVGTAVVHARVRRGAWTDADVSSRAERPAFLLFALGLCGVCAAALMATRASHEWLIGIGGCATVLTCALALHAWWKVSMHTAFAVYAACFTGLASPAAGFLLSVAAALVGVSRVRLGRHDPGEVWVGAAVGLAAGALHTVASLEATM
jgi:membrane-associated phospholipid phosphatase